MSQVSLYLNDAAMAQLRSVCKKEQRSLSSYVSELIMDNRNSTSWPKGYWDSVYGCLNDDSFIVPPDLDAVTDGPLPAFD
ncbi:hypothetical protein [Adlercreutzia sp. ZJ304]|uniref:hypothetical protein n=1 Tax=Adlercreutzia sp. ZJ304 TaxID=2709791 RepID=UPI0013ED5E69|nr:hypothetical protein [Adlercreutzia sp. ZJ304]